MLLINYSLNFSLPTSSERINTVAPWPGVLKKQGKQEHFSSGKLTISLCVFKLTAVLVESAQSKVKALPSTVQEDSAT
jgi:hypothetical protein